MSREKNSVGFKIVAYISIVVSAWMILGTLFVSIKYGLEIPVGAIILAFAASLTLLIAGIGALKSTKAGLYLYSGSSIIWLIRTALQIIMGEKAQSMPIWVVVFVKAGGIWLLLSILGIIACYHEIRKLYRVAFNKNNT